MNYYHKLSENCSMFFDREKNCLTNNSGKKIRGANDYLKIASWSLYNMNL